MYIYAYMHIYYFINMNKRIAKAITGMSGCQIRVYEKLDIYFVLSLFQKYKMKKNIKRLIFD